MESAPWNSPKPLQKTITKQNAQLWSSYEQLILPNTFLHLRLMERSGRGGSTIVKAIRSESLL